jgi:hypothetical protein
MDLLWYNHSVSITNWVIYIELFRMRMVYALPQDER